MRILITGAGGQLGRDLIDALAAHELLPLPHRDLDVTDEPAVRAAIDAFRPNVVVHAAALTDTTRCEREPDLARAVNASGARNVAEACARAGAAMALISTNEVFDGEQRTPYAEDAEPSPVNSYGWSKLEGERLVRGALDAYYIVRTAWLYGARGNNFVAKVLAAAGRSANLTGVTDETATPTYTRDLAGALARLIETRDYGTYHLTNAGETSRYDWMREVIRLAGRTDVTVRPVTTAEFRASLADDALAPRKPPYSVLANRRAAALGIALRPWQDALAEYLSQA